MGLGREMKNILVHGSFANSLPSMITIGPFAKSWLLLCFRFLSWCRSAPPLQPVFTKHATFYQPLQCQDSVQAFFSSSKEPEGNALVSKLLGPGPIACGWLDLFLFASTVVLTPGAGSKAGYGMPSQDYFCGYEYSLERSEARLSPYH